VDPPPFDSSLGNSFKSDGMARNSNVSTLKSNSTASLDGREATHWQAITGSRVLTSLMKCNVLHNPAGRAGQDYTLIAKPAFLAAQKSFAVHPASHVATYLFHLGAADAEVYARTTGVPAGTRCYVGAG
jgi:hypothetical protein